MSVDEYRGRAIVVHYDAKRCIHAAECVRGAPQVFDPDARPWITPDGADADYLAEVISRCPTGALTATGLDGESLEPPPLRNHATVAARGPIYLRGRITFSGGEHADLVEYQRVALCRCGASANKPFCDGSHSRVGFADDGACKSPPASQAAQPDGPVQLMPQENGPLEILGTIEFESADLQRFVIEDVFLCRCGASRNKPFCDGSHKQIGFVG